MGDKNMKDDNKEDKQEVKSAKEPVQGSKNYKRNEETVKSEKLRYKNADDLYD